MATPSAVYNGTIYQDVKILELGDDAIIAATAFLAYSHLLLLGQEIQYIWNRPIRPASCLYVLIRYPALLCQLILISLNSYTPHCNSIDQLAAWSQNIAETTTFLVLTLRTYAVCGKSRLLAALLLILCLPAVGILTLSSIRTSCTSFNVISPLLETVSGVLDFVFESVVVGATIWATWSQARINDSRLSRRTIAHSLLRNGLVYYGIFLGLEVCYLASYDLKQTPTVRMVNVFLSQLNDPIKWALTSQFLLELSERSEKLGSLSGVSLPTISSFHTTITFLQASIDQDFGEPLVHPMHNMDFDEMDGFQGRGQTEVTAQTEEARREFESEQDLELRERYLEQGVGNQDGLDA